MRILYKKHLEGKKVLFIFLLTNIIYLIMIFITIPRVMSFSNGNDLFDMMPAGYSADYAQNLLSTLGQEGRNDYLTVQLPVDFIYPLLFGLCYSLIIAYFLAKLNRFDRPDFYLILLPIIAGLFDYLENFGIILMILHYPNFSLVTASFANTCTIIKSGLSVLSFTLLLFLVGVFLIRSVKSQK